MHIWVKKKIIKAAPCNGVYIKLHYFLFPYPQKNVNILKATMFGSMKHIPPTVYSIKFIKLMN